MSENNQTYKADNGKTRLDLVSPTFIEAVGRIRTFGVQKYGDSDSWTKVEPQRYIAALLRHINAYRMGEEIDKESGMSHLWHAACNLMFLIDLDELKTVSFGEGDTPPKENKSVGLCTPTRKSCVNCLLFCECDRLPKNGNVFCSKWQSDMVEETKAAISALPDTPPKEHSYLNCKHLHECCGSPYCGIKGDFGKGCNICPDWEYKF